MFYLIIALLYLCIFSVGSLTSCASLTTTDNDKALLQNQLFKEIQKGNLDKVKELLKAHANVSDVNDSGSTPLHCAVLFNHFDIAHFLIKAGALVNAHNTQDGNTPLHDVVDEGSADMVRLLINRKADVTLQNHEGHTPLYEAQKKSKTAMLFP